MVMSAVIRLLVCDIDGTLVRDDKSLDDAVVAAVKRCIAAGVRVSLISARPPSGVLWIAERLGLTGAVGAFNGGTVLAANGDVLSAEYLEAPSAHRTLELLEAAGVAPWLFAKGRWYARDTHTNHMMRERLAANVEPTLCDSFAGLADEVDKIVGVSDDHGLLAAVEADLVVALGDRATVARSQPYYLDITSRLSNKGAGVTALAQRYGLSLAETAVIGDQNNDIAMFKVAGFAIAMGQAPENVRLAADAVTRSNNADGVAYAIDTIILPMVAKTVPGATPESKS
jgi:Cof subfamily protein (haloacid dehalogenase superfamily)